VTTTINATKSGRIRRKKQETPNVNKIYSENLKERKKGRKKEEKRKKERKKERKTFLAGRVKITLKKALRKECVTVYRDFFKLST
jgi:hypothetical protein